MSRSKPINNLAYLDTFTSRKVEEGVRPLVGETPDSLAAWIERYLLLAVHGVRAEAVAEKIALHLERFIACFTQAYGHDRNSTVLKRDVVAWQPALVEQGLAPATVNNH